MYKWSRISIEFTMFVYFSHDFEFWASGSSSDQLCHDALFSVSSFCSGKKQHSPSLKSSSLFFFITTLFHFCGRLIRLNKGNLKRHCPNKRRESRTWTHNKTELCEFCCSGFPAWFIDNSYTYIYIIDTRTKKKEGAVACSALQQLSNKKMAVKSAWV